MTRLLGTVLAITRPRVSGFGWLWSRLVSPVYHVVSSHVAKRRWRDGMLLVGWAWRSHWEKVI
jgi:hypothetical protein